MTTVNVTKALATYLDTLEARIAASPEDYEVQLQHAGGIDTIFSLLDMGALAVTELSASRIVLSHTDGGGNWSMALTGSGISPVSSLEALIDAIDEGIAQGQFTQLRLARNATTLATIDFSATGYTLTSGGDSLAVTGSLPASFGDLFALADLMSGLDHLDAMTAGQRAALFSQLAAWGITGMELSNATRTLLSWEITPTTARIALPGVTLTAQGIFPADFGALAAALYQMAQLDGDGPLDLSLVDGLELTHLLLSDEDGRALLEVTNIHNTDLSRFHSLLVDGVQMPLDTVILREDVLLTPDWVIDHELVLGTAGNDYLEGGGGRDWIISNAGADTLDGGSGSDTLDSGSGHDLLWAGAGDDRVYGGGGNDTIHGGGGSNHLLGGSGKDTIIGGRGRDTIAGGADDDRISGEGNADRINGDDGKDWIEGGNGNDRIYGDLGNDTIYGGAGSDRIYGGKGNDRLYGTGDTISGGQGDDRLYGTDSRVAGGEGADRFIFTRESGRNTVTDFTGGTDQLRLEWQGIADISDLVIDDVSAGARLRGGGNVLFLLGVSSDDLDAADFLFG